MQRFAKPWTSVQFRYRPPLNLNRSLIIVYNNSFRKTGFKNNPQDRLNRFNNQSNNSSGPKFSKHITASTVRLIDQNDQNIGIVPLKEAVDRATEVDLDLIEISSNSNPPVVKIMDLGKWKYEEAKKKSAIKKKQKVIDLKELKFSSNIEENDYQVKLRNGKKFISEGNKVKISLRFRGREIANRDIAKKLFDRLIVDFSDVAKVFVAPKLEGRQMTMQLSPNTDKK